MEIHSRATILNSEYCAPDLYHKLYNCGIAATWPSGISGFYRCGALACVRCRRTHRAAFCADAARLFRARPASALRTIEVDLPPAPSLVSLRAALLTFKRDLRNLVGRWRSKHPKACGSRFYGAVDMVPVPFGWRAGARILCDLAGASEIPLADLLLRKWPAARICAAGALADEIEALWPSLSDCSVEFLNYLHCNRNLQILRVHVRPQRTALRRSAGSPQAAQSGWSCQPLPITF